MVEIHVLPAVRRNKGLAFQQKYQQAVKVA